MTTKTKSAPQQRQHKIPPPPDPPSPSKDETQYEKCKRLSDFYTSLYENDVPMLSSKELLAMMNDDSSSANVVIVDVRSEDEMQVSMLPGAMTMNEFETSNDADSQRDRPIVVCYCTVGYRSGFHARRILSASNNTTADISRTVYNLDGILSYTHEQGPLIEPKSGRSTNRVHTYGSKWACLHSDYKAVYHSKTGMIVTFILSTISRILLEPYPLWYGAAWMTAVLCFIIGQPIIASILVVGISVIRWQSLWCKQGGSKEGYSRIAEEV